MKKIIALALLVLMTIGAVAYRAPIVKSAEKVFNYSKCDNPKTYRIGSIDPKYNMTKDQFLYHIQNASDIWADAYGKNLFVYDPNGAIEINLVYDERSFLSTQIDALNEKVREQQKTLDPEISSYKSRAAEFRAKVGQLNRDIEYWNNRGGAPSEEYEKLKSRQTVLQQEAQTLQQEAERLNQSTDEYNQQVGQLHQTVDTFNSALEYKPEEGEYILENGKETINIYFDNSETELTHTLAHELGHALGIGHNNNESSIMFPKTTEVVSLSEEDMNGLAEACERKSIFTIYGERLSVVINQLRLQMAN